MYFLFVEMLLVKFFSRISDTNVLQCSLSGQIEMKGWECNLIKFKVYEKKGQISISVLKMH